MPLIQAPAPNRTITSSFSFDRPKDAAPTKPITSQQFIEIESQVVRPQVKPRFTFSSPALSSSISSASTNKRSYADTARKPTVPTTRPVLGSPPVKTKKVKKIKLDDFVIDSSPMLIDQETEKRMARESRFNGAQEKRDAKEYSQAIINRKAKVFNGNRLMDRKYF
jgi:hypothetical protein